MKLFGARAGHNPKKSKAPSPSVPTSFKKPLSYTQQFKQTMKVAPWENDVVKNIVMLISEGEPDARYVEMLTRVARRRLQHAKYNNINEYRRLEGMIDPYDMAVLVNNPDSALGKRLARHFKIPEWETDCEHGKTGWGGVHTNALFDPLRAR